MVAIEGKICLVYLDDILVCSKTFEEYLQLLQHVFERLKKAGFTLKPRKCCFLRKNVIYLGHIISGKGIAPDLVKLRKSILAALFQQISQNSVSLLGFHLITDVLFHGFPKSLILCYKLMKKGAVFEWNTACQFASGFQQPQRVV